MNYTECMVNAVTNTYMLAEGEGKRTNGYSVCLINSLAQTEKEVGS